MINISMYNVRQNKEVKKKQIYASDVKEIETFLVQVRLGSIFAWLYMNIVQFKRVSSFSA